MKNPLLGFKNYVASSVHKWYSERKLREFLGDEIKKGTMIIKKDEEGNPYACMHTSEDI
jgi:hypothetical protein